LLSLLLSHRPPEADLDVPRIFREHGDFLWRSLQRLGVRDADLDDVMQEVLMVVHTRRSTFDGSSKVTTWLYGIARRVAAGYRRKGYRQREIPTGEESPQEDARTPESLLEDARRQRKLGEVLDAMDLDRRSVFVMYEIDGLGCPEIADILGVPVGTVYSRIHAARQEFQQIVARRQAAERRAG